MLPFTSRRYVSTAVFSLFTALLPCLVSAQTAGRSVAAVEMPPAIETAEKSAAQWIVRQMVPNDTVPSPDPARRRLLLSYQVPRDDPAYKYISGRSFIYDDALGAIALTMLGRYRETEFLLSGLVRLVRPDGSLWFAYNTQNDWPGEKDRDGALIRTGSVAWVGFALTYYIRIRSREEPGFLTRDVLGIEYRQAAESLARFVVAHQVTDRADRRFGLVTGGAGSSTVAFSDQASRPVEAYDPGKVGWVSMEHNIDAWFFLRELGRLTSNKTWTTAAGLIGERLMSLWSEKDGQFIQGIRENMAPDAVLPLDGASWGALFLLAQGRDVQARRCLAAMEGRFKSSFDGSTGYRPYGPEPVYSDEQVNRFYFPGNPSQLWKDLDFVWGEGSLGAAAALLRAGEREACLKIIEALLPLQKDDGFRYASSPVAYQFTDYPSVATTSWFIIAVEMLRGAPAGDSFWGT